MEQELLVAIQDGLSHFIQTVNWMYCAVFMFSAWLFNGAVSMTNSFKWLNWLGKLPKAWRTCLLGIVVMIFFVWSYDLVSKQDISSLLLSLLASMGIWKFGIDKAIEYLKKKIGVKSK